jgi:hypothetical protein
MWAPRAGCARSSNRRHSSSEGIQALALNKPTWVSPGRPILPMITYSGLRLPARRSGLSAGSPQLESAPVSVKRVELNRRHVRFQGSRTRNSARVFFSRFAFQMQACAVEGGH